MHDDPGRGEGGACQGAGCDTGLVCSSGPTIFSITSSLESEICLQECADDSSCDGPEYCEDSGVADQDFCWPDSERNELCLSEKGCANDANLSCHPIVGLAFECVDLCDGADVYTTAGCTGSDTCLPQPSWELEEAGTPPTPKQCPNGNGDCAASYSCVTFSDGDYCARHPGICGTTTPIAQDFTAAGIEGMLDEFAANGTQTLCEAPGHSWFCGAPTSGNAEVECTELNSAFNYSEEYDQRFDCDYNPASQLFNLDCALLGGECVDFEPPSCGFLAKTCVAFCESADGLPIADACVNPALCGAPDVGIGQPVLQGGPTGVTCPSPGQPDGCDAGNGFGCVAFADGNLCARSRRVCGIVGVTGP